LKEAYDIYIRIYNINGILLSNSIQANDSHLIKEFSFENLSPGIYFLKVNVEDEEMILKFVKL